MLGEYFYWIFNMSIIASFMGLIVMLIRLIRKIPRRVSVFLWVIPFLRMCIPVWLNSRYSLMSIVSRFTTKTITVYSPGGVNFSFTNIVMAADDYFPIIYKKETLYKVFDVASFVWAVTALAIFIALGTLYFTTLHEMKDARHLRDNIFLSDSIRSPAVYGIIKPRIILPSSYEYKDNRYVLRHEATHIRRADNLWRLLAFSVVSIHWFNPLAWVFLRLFIADSELACDETAIAKYGTEERKAYARSLLDCAESKNLFASAFGGAKVRTRIEKILFNKKTTFFSAFCFSILIMSILFVMLTNAG